MDTRDIIAGLLAYSGAADQTGAAEMRADARRWLRDHAARAEGDVLSRKAYMAYESDDTTPFESYLAYAVTENEFGWSTGDDEGDTMPLCVAGLTRQSEVGRAAFELVDQAATFLDTLERGAPHIPLAFIHSVWARVLRTVCVWMCG